MLVLSRKNDEAVVIGGSEGFERMIKVTVVEIKNGRVRLGFEADADVPVHRLDQICRIADASRRLSAVDRAGNQSTSESLLLR